MVVGTIVDLVKNLREYLQRCGKCSAGQNNEMQQKKKKKKKSSKLYWKR